MIDTFFDELRRADALLDRAQGVLYEPPGSDAALERSAASRRTKTARTLARSRPRHAAPGAPSSRLRQGAIRTRIGQFLRVVMLFVGTAALACGVLLIWGAHRTGDLRLTALALAILLAAQSLWVATVLGGFRRRVTDSGRERTADKLTMNRSRAPVSIRR